jgi:polyphenol oxidase
MGNKSTQISKKRSKNTREASAMKKGVAAAATKSTSSDRFTQSEIAANLADAGFKRERPLEAPYAIKKQRAKRDAERATKSPKGGAIQVLRAEKLEEIPWLIHGFSTRMGGVTPEYGGNALNLGLTKEETRANFEKNLELWKAALLDRSQAGAASLPLKSLKQIHSAIIHKITNRDDQPAAGDGLITNVPGVLLAVKTADCLPVIVVDPVKLAVGVFHAGWRGTLQRIVEKGVGEMRKHYGSDPTDLVAAIGPGIGKCCYEVGDEVMDLFDSQFAFSRELFEDVFDSHALHLKYPLLFMNQRAPGHGEPAARPHLDLMKANRIQLLKAGVPEKHISVLDYCTSCRTDLFFSHRKEQVTGRMMATVGIREKQERSLGNEKARPKGRA